MKWKKIWQVVPKEKPAIALRSKLGMVQQLSLKETTKTPLMQSVQVLLHQTFEEQRDKVTLSP